MKILSNLYHWPLSLFNQSDKPRIGFSFHYIYLKSDDFLMLKLLSSYSFQPCIIDYFFHNVSHCLRIPRTHAEKHSLTEKKIVASEAMLLQKSLN